MCRNIKPLYNLDPPVSDDEVKDAALQFVRKVSGYRKPSKVNEPAFEAAVKEIARATHTLLDSLETSAEPRDREALAAKARVHAARRYGA